MNTNAHIDALVTNNVVADASRTFQENITRYINAPIMFSSTIMGGYASASLDLAVDDLTAWRFLNTYLGSRLVFTNAHATNSQLIVWEGLIFTVTVDDGKSLISRSLANLYNQVRVSYSTITFDANNNPVFGSQVNTADANYATNQSSYGIRELTYMIGGASAVDAAGLRDTLLSKYELALATPQKVLRGGGGSPQNLRVTVEAVGAWETLDKRFYSSATTGNANIDVSVKAALTSKGQFVNADQSHVAANTQAHTQYEAGQRTAQRYLEVLCALGGPNNRRFYLQLLELGTPYYFEEPTAAAYKARRLDPTEAVYDAVTGAEVPPWLVLPGRIIQFDDLLPDAVVYSTALGNPRAFLIAETRFTAPNLLEMIPMVDDPSQLNLARMGLIS